MTIPWYMKETSLMLFILLAEVRIKRFHTDQNLRGAAFKGFFSANAALLLYLRLTIEHG